jgi:hypothetical protein
VRLMLLTPSPVSLMAEGVNFWGVCAGSLEADLSVPSFFPSDVGVG